MAQFPPVIYDAGLQQHRPAGAGDTVANNLAPEAYTATTTAPVTPLVGDRWKNTSLATVAGVPPGSTGTWNGTAWDVEGTGSPEFYTAAAAAPAAPNTGDRWRNTSGITVSGIPAGRSASWTGAAWDLEAADEVYTAAIAAPTTPKVGDRWKNTSAGVVSGVPAGVTATWNGATWDFPASAPEVFTSAAVPPVAPAVGDHWQNTTAGTVSGVQAGQTGVWTGAVWLQTTNPQGLAIFAAARNRMVPGEIANPGAPQEMEGFASGVFTGTTPANGKYTFTFTTPQPSTAYKIFGVHAAYDNSVTGMQVDIKNIFADVLLGANITNKTVNGFELTFAGKINNTVGGLGSFWATPFNIYCVR